MLFPQEIYLRGVEGSRGTSLRVSWAHFIFLQVDHKQINNASVERAGLRRASRMVEELGPGNSALQSKARCLEDNVFLSVMMSGFFAAVLWEYVPAFRALSRGVFESLADDMFSDPEAALFVMGFLLLVWALVAALRFAAHLIADLLSGTMRSGPQGLGLN